jgi:dinuclear metal center YbgI/SA1388 family protein
MTAARDDILGYLDAYLQTGAFEDYGPVGLQVEGRRQVGRVVTGVSACVELFEAAVAAGADMVLVHHGMLWTGADPVVRGPFRRRLELLLGAGITLAVYHLCLDAHPELGNNVLGARALGLEDVEPWGLHRGRAIGVRGRWPLPPTPEQAVARVATAFEGPVLSFLHGPPAVATVALVSGGAQRDIHPAIADGLDMFVTGEASEFVMHAAKEGGIHFAAAGHHNTERLGIRALGEHVAARFGVAHTFVDTPNPV